MAKDIKKISDYKPKDILIFLELLKPKTDVMKTFMPSVKYMFQIKDERFVYTPHLMKLVQTILKERNLNLSCDTYYSSWIGNTRHSNLSLTLTKV